MEVEEKDLEEGELKEGNEGKQQQEEVQQTQQVSQFLDIEATEENVVKAQSGRKKLEKITSLPSQKSLISNVSFLLMKFNFFFRLSQNFSQIVIPY